MPTCGGIENLQLQPVSANGLNVLNDDVLLTLFEYLRGTGSLSILAKTCRRFRIALKPMLFAKCRIRREVTYTHRALPPSTIWPYIRFMSVACTFPPLRKDYGMTDFQDSYGPLMNALSRMPNLVSIDLDAWRPIDCDVAMIPWEAVKAMLTPPQLRDVRFSGGFDDRIVLPDQDELLSSLPVAPLKSYTRVPAYYCTTDDPTSLEIHFVSSLAERPEVHESLETLVLPSECAPLESFHTHVWPRLRVLSLHGPLKNLKREGGLVPWMAFLGHMPQLASLTLDFAHPDGESRQPIWPHNAEFICPWQNLESLSITYPHPEDELYSHLPPSLRQLSLRCWPRHYIYLAPEERHHLIMLGWRSPISTSSEMLAALRACKLTLLDQLDIEFEECPGDGALFRSLPTLFPNLTVLTIHRYRSRSSEVVPVASISEALSALRQLRVLRLHLDFPNAPSLFARSRPAEVLDTLQYTADCFARNLAGVEWVCILVRHRNINRFTPYRVVRDGNTPRAQCDMRADDAGGVPIYDDYGPPVPRYIR